MKVYLDYGEGRLELEVPSDATIVEAPAVTPIHDPVTALARALRQPVSGPPVRQLVRSGDRVVVSVCDGTRPQPRREMLAAILSELSEHVAAKQVTVLVANGTHRLAAPDELRALLGEDVLQRCEVINHDCRDVGQLARMGTVAGDVPVALNRTWVEADVRISAGLVEPHPFAGFSGGPKMVAPGCSGLETVLGLHNARRVADPRATWGTLEGNPVQEAIRAVAAKAPPAFAIDVLLDAERRIIDVFAGELSAVHARGCAAARRTAMHGVSRRFPLVITSSGGYPFDQNLLQATKGISAAAEIVADGGVIVCAAECRNGMGNEDLYTFLFESSDNPCDVNARILQSDTVIPDQWGVQLQTRVQERARVLVKADGLTAAQLRAAHVEGVEDVNAFVHAELERNPSLAVAVLPSGFQCVPFVR